MTRRTAALTGAALVLTAGLVTIPPAAACGCGGFAVSSESAEAMDVVGEQAVVSLSGGTERVQIALDTISDAPEAALVIPTPTAATASLGSAAVFEALEEVSAPQREEVSVWWPSGVIGWGAGAPGDGAGAPAGPPVEVFQEVTLGPLEVVSLGSDDLEGLLARLDERGFALSPSLQAEMADYVTDGWSFVAIKLSPEGELLDGEIPPIELRFASDELVYPMRLSAAATSAQRVRTYVVSDTRMDRTDVQADGAELLFAGSLGGLAVPELAYWAAPFGEDTYVTATEQVFEQPDREIVADFTYAPSDAEPFHRTYTVKVERMIGPFFAGPVLLVLGIGLTFGVVFLARRAALRRRRRPASGAPLPGGPAAR